MSGNPFEEALRELYGDEQATRLVDAARPVARTEQSDASADTPSGTKTVGRRGPKRTGLPNGADGRGEPSTLGRRVSAGTLSNALGHGSADALLAEVGISAAVADHVAACERVLEARGHVTEIVSLRWGVLTVRCGAITAHQLRIDADQVCAQANDQIGEVMVSRIKVQVES